jgi:hypothetical protein
MQQYRTNIDKLLATMSNHVYNKYAAGITSPAKPERFFLLTIARQMEPTDKTTKEAILTLINE